MFTLRYYLTGCPCFEWHYKYRASPIPSDMMTVLTKYNFDLNDIQFKNAQPYAPLEQLMFILPPQMSFLVPSCLQKIMKECHEFYPKTFEIDALAGSKYIYSEAILPEIDTTILKEKIMNKLDELSEAEKRRNTISTKLIFTKL
jgi:5'-3' exonuclease